ncbi:hypothetical protein [Streptosporangium lutulentum]
MSKTLGVTAGLVGAAVVGAYAAPASAQGSKLRAQRKGLIMVHFANFHCTRPNDPGGIFESGVDDVSLKFDHIEIWRGEMKGGRTRNVDRQMVMSGPEMRVWALEHDNIGGDDLLGTQVIRQDEVSKGWRRAYFQVGADYYVDYNVWQS